MPRLVAGLPLLCRMYRSCLLLLYQCSSAAAGHKFAQVTAASALATSAGTCLPLLFPAKLYHLPLLFLAEQHQAALQSVMVCLQAEEAEQEAQDMISIYAEFARNVAAMPVMVGRKSRLESFAGANSTYTIEAMMGDKRALQVTLINPKLRKSVSSTMYHYHYVVLCCHLVCPVAMCLAIHVTLKPLHKFDL